MTSVTLSSITRRVDVFSAARDSRARRKLDKFVLVTDPAFGAVADGVDTGSAFTGTDNTGAFLAALTYCEENGLGLHVPSGNYRFAHQSLSNAGYVALPGDRYVMRGDGPDSVLMIDDDPAWYDGTLADRNACFLFATPASADGNREEHDLFMVMDIAIKGRWSHVQGKGGPSGFRVEGYREAVFENVHAYDVRNKLVRAKSCRSFVGRNSHGERLGRGMYRTQDTDKVTCTGNYIREADDDVFDFHSSDLWADAFPARTSIVVTNNHLEKCEGIVCLGAKHTVVADNTLKLCHGNSIHLGSSGTVEGNAAGTTVIVSDNVVEDPIERYDNGVLGSTNTNQGAIAVAGIAKSSHSTSGVVPGTYEAQKTFTADAATDVCTAAAHGWFTGDGPFRLSNSGGALPAGLATATDYYLIKVDADTFKLATSRANADAGTAVDITDSGTGTHSLGRDFILPYGRSGSTPDWGFMNVGDTWDEGSDLTIYSNPGGIGFSVVGNIVMRTLPDVAAYSDWGQGEMFNGAEGYVDPPVTSANFRAHCIIIMGDLELGTIAGNTCFGLPESGVRLRATTALDEQSAFRQITIALNQFKDLKNGISKTTIGGDFPFDEWDDWSILIALNQFDLDPYHKASFRKHPLDGTWTVDSGTAYRGVYARNAKGFVFRGNTYKNCYQPIGGNSNIRDQFDIANELVICNPAAVVFSTSNGGVAVPEPAGEAFRHLIIDANPTSATYGEVLNTCVTAADSIPTSGTYVKGHIVVNTSPSISSGKVLIGWKRVTNGSGHVSGTDWAPLFCTTS